MERLMKLQLNQIILIGCFLAVFSAPIHAQLPTVGSASVTLHYDAASLSGSHNHGDPVQTWPATVGPDAMAEVAGRQPTFNSNWSPAGLPGVTFDGENAAPSYQLWAQSGSHGSPKATLWSSIGAPNRQKLAKTLGKHLFSKID